MRPLVCLSFLFVFQLHSQNNSEDTLKLMVISHRVGEKIDLTEREQFHIMPSIKNYWSASFYQSTSNLYYALIESKNIDGEVISEIKEYPLNVLFRMAEKINNFEEISAGRYLSGEEQVTLEVVGGEPLVWAPVLPQTRTLKSKSSGDRESQTQSSVIPILTSYNPFELHISFGYGFSNGAPPMSSFTETINYNSPSYREITEANDKYVSLGEGNRVELKGIYFFLEQVGAFIELGYTYGTAEQTVVSESYYSFTSPTTLIKNQQSLKFNTTPLIFGLHFRLSNQIVNPYFGAGAGLWFPPDLKFKLKQLSYSNTSSEREQKLELNTPVGYTGYCGFTIPLSLTLDFFIERKASMATYYVTRTEIIKYVVDGKDQLSGLSTRQKIVIYETNKNYKEMPIYDSNSPQIGGPPYPIVAGSVSVVGGIAIRF